MKKLNFIKSVFLLFISFSICACQQQEKTQPIEPIHSFNDVDFSTIEPNTLVVFDVDETLTQPTDTYLINEHSPQAEAFKKKLFQQHPEVKDWNGLASIMLQEAPRPLIEPVVVQKIKELEARGILVIACTGMNTGPYGSLPTLEEWRYKHLKSLGFQGSYGDLIFKVKGLEQNPVFYKGILATDTELKGPILGAFLDQVRLTPHKIVMFDDHLHFLESVQRECEKRGIAFHGYQYQGAHAKPWDEALIQFQADYLIRN
ncbi:MAG: DUF2608 domain-containing protein, partial [Bacillota bacterium]|nr:DUF2608 domain-containing protein [Bacillota bacterium]